MKNFKKIASAIAALSLAACVAVPMSATVFTASAADPSTYTIEITDADTGYTYKAYQIFKGTIDSTGKILGNIGWGDAVKQTDATLYSDIKEALGSATDFTTAADVAKALETNKEKAEAFAKAIAKHIDKTNGIESTAGSGKYTIDVSAKDAGYYLVENSSVPETDSAYTAYILQVLGKETVSTKKAKPTVDKQVLDDDASDKSDTTKGSTEDSGNSTAIGNGSGWGETADHAINDSFQFKLIATLPADTDFAAYETYKVVFDDVMSKGVSYDDIVSVNVIVGEGSPIKVEEGAEDGNYALDFSEFTDVEEAPYAGNGTKKWTLTIPDLKKVSGVTLDGSKEIKIEVVYKAHLNEEAEVTTTTDTDTPNENKVKLEYSNNPNASGSGDWRDNHDETPDDSVWVFTYEVDNKKVDEDGNALAGAGFTLYDSTGETIIPLYKGTDGLYYPYDATINSGSTPLNTENQIITATESDGNIFKFKGLDAGTYVLKETQTPPGYNTCEDITIEIEATHAENNPGSAVKNVVNFSKSTGMNNNIENKQGATLPSTGGIGTTLFYLGGGALVAVAGVMLITKKRMTKE